MIRAPRASPTAATSAIPAATATEPAPAASPTSASPPNVITPPTRAPAENVAHAISVVRIRPA